MIDKGGISLSKSANRLNPMLIRNIHLDLNNISNKEQELMTSNISDTTKPQQFHIDSKNKITRNINFIHTHRKFNFDIAKHSTGCFDSKNINSVIKQFFQSNNQWGAYNKRKPAKKNSNKHNRDNSKQKIITLNLNNAQNNNDEIQQLNSFEIEGKRSIPIQSLKLYLLDRQQCRWNSNPSNSELVKNSIQFHSKVPSYLHKTPLRKQELIKSAHPLIPQNNNNNNNNNNDTSTLPMLIGNSPFPHSLEKRNTFKESSTNNLKDKYKEDFKFKDDLSYYNHKLFNYYIIHPGNCGYLIKRSLNYRINWRESQNNSTLYYNFQWKDCSSGINYSKVSFDKKFLQCVNHYEYHSALSNKANMFCNLMQYCEENNKEVFQYIPFTIVLMHDGTTFYDSIDSFKQIYDNITNYLYDYEDIKQKRFSRKNTSYHSLFQSKDSRIGLKTNIMISRTHHDRKNLWIFKAPNLNRGRGIKLINSFELVNKYVKQIISGRLQDYSDENDNKIKGMETQMQYHSSKIVIQKYVERPLLYYNRKFDIRLWVLITHKFEVYAFKEGHLKVCSVDYNCNDSNAYVHLTNYSLQKYNQHFSQYEKGNEVSFESFQGYLDSKYADKHLSVKDDLFLKYKEIIELTCRSVKSKLNQGNKRECFEIFGYDFLMDVDFNTYLIEINTNPGLEESSEIIKCLISRMLDDALRLTIDEIYTTKYRKDCLDAYMNYISPYKVKGYDDKANMWDFVCDLNKAKDKKGLVQRKKKLKKKRKGKPMNE